MGATPLCEHLLAIAIVPQVASLRLVSNRGWGVGLVDRKGVCRFDGSSAGTAHMVGRASE